VTVIDAHNTADLLGHDLPRFLSNMDRFGIEEICLLARHCPPNRYHPAGHCSTTHFGSCAARVPSAAWLPYPVTPRAGCIELEQIA